VFLEQARAACLDGAGTVVTWAQEPPEVNPVVGTGRAAPWPSASPPAGPAVQAAATRVRTLLGRLEDGPLATVVLAPAAQAVVDRWDDDLRRLARGGPPQVAAHDGPAAAGAVGDGLVELERDPAALRDRCCARCPGSRRR
jgi:hypothetical protein